MKRTFLVILGFLSLFSIAGLATAFGLDLTTGSPLDLASLGLSSFGLVGMAKVTGPLMSMDARGKFGGTLVFSGWKGRSTVRTLVTPSNPQSAGQQASRNAVRVGGAMQRFANLTTTKGDGRLVTDKAALALAAPSGQAWNGYLVNQLVGAGSLNYTAGQAAYALLTVGNKTTWNVAAAALVPAIPAVNQVGAGGAAATALAAGNVFYLHVYALFKAGIGAAPVAATPPVYA